MTRYPPERIQEIIRSDFTIECLDEPELDSPLSGVEFVADEHRVPYFNRTDVLAQLAPDTPMPSFELAGPRSRIRHDPAWSRAAIVTCGGLCPGINDVIKSLVNTLSHSYGIRHIFGIRYGFRGLVPGYRLEPMLLTPDEVDGIHENGGSILGSSRGEQDTQEMVETLDRLNINLLFCIGGDGTMRAARDIAVAARARNLAISVIGVPKTIDNDLDFLDRTFGFETAVYAAAPVIGCAHDEAKGAYNGIGLVRLMGRDAGFIAACATLANSVANFCLIPEVPFHLEGPGGLFEALERRLAEKNHVVIVVAEGAGQHLFDEESGNKDASGNVLHHDIGILLRERIHRYLTERGIDHSMKYFDPSYMIRSVPARGMDAIFCLHLAENAVHAAMSGRTNMVVGHWHGLFTHVPIALATRQRRKIDPQGQLWQSVLNVTLQQRYWHRS